jgi:hypothetical protein
MFGCIRELDTSMFQHPRSGSIIVEMKIEIPQHPRSG